MENGKVVVNYMATHTNHQINLKECKHLPLPQSVSTQVQTMLANGVQVDKVLDGKLLNGNKQLIPKVFTSYIHHIMVHVSAL